MTAPTYTVDDVTRLLDAVVSGIRVGGVDDTLYTLPEVAERTKVALRTLEEDCLAGRVEHTLKGRTRGMTPTQVALMLRQHRVPAKGDVQPAPALPGNGLDQAREASRRAAGRRGRRDA
jgi:hypothetical protein